MEFQPEQNPSERLLIENYIDEGQLHEFVKQGYSDSDIVAALVEDYGQQSGISKRSVQRMKVKYGISKWTRLSTEEVNQVVIDGVFTVSITQMRRKRLMVCSLVIMLAFEKWTVFYVVKVLSYHLIKFGLQ